MTLGERVRLLRTRTGLTQRELGHLALIHSNTIARIEGADVSDPGGKLVARLARALETTSDYLRGLTEDTQLPACSAAQEPAPVLE
jgi:transcriptional regulator with XRE-family HTH domain